MIINNGYIQLQQRNATGIWPQLWFFPIFESKQQLLSSELMNSTSINDCKYLHFNIQHILTHRKLDLQVHCFQNNTIINSNLNNNANQYSKWIEISQFKKLPHPTALVKIIQHFVINEGN
jgi:adenine-specific DNA glycosylase